MPKNKLEEVIFTFIMATCMVYGMIVYNIALNTGVVQGITFTTAIHELIIMMPIAFVLELFVVGKIAAKLTFSVMRPTDRPQFITYMMSVCICGIMCPIMSLIATFLFNDAPSFGMWIKVWALNFPMGDLLSDAVLRAVCAFGFPFDRFAVKKQFYSEGKPETAQF